MHKVTQVHLKSNKKKIFVSSKINTSFSAVLLFKYLNIQIFLSKVINDDISTKKGRNISVPIDRFCRCVAATRTNKDINIYGLMEVFGFC